MWKSPKSRAEQQFAAGQKKDQTLIKQKEKAQRERDERMARLRELRLAKEATDKEAGEKAAEATSDPAQSAAKGSGVKIADTAPPNDRNADRGDEEH